MESEEGNPKTCITLVCVFMSTYGYGSLVFLIWLSKLDIDDIYPRVFIVVRFSYWEIVVVVTKGRLKEELLQDVNLNSL